MEIDECSPHANVSPRRATIDGETVLFLSSQQIFVGVILEANVFHNTLIALIAAVALGLPATTALAAGHAPAGGHRGYAMTNHSRGGHGARYYGSGYRGGPIYDNCAGYGYRGCGVGGAVGNIIGDFVY
jgi:hypothetical protein